MKALANNPMYVRSPQATRTPAHINDVLKFCSRVIEAESSKVAEKIIHTVPGIEYSMIEIADTVKRVLDSNSEIIHEEYEQSELIDGQLAREWTISKTAKELGVTCNVLLDEGIKRTAPYIREVMENPQPIIS